MSLVALDLETTGLVPGHHEIIEISAVALDDMARPIPDKQFFRRLMPKHLDRAGEGVMGVYNHWDQEVWNKEAVGQGQGMQEFNDWLLSQGSRMMPLGHNVGFDTSFLDTWGTVYGVQFHKDYHKIDTVVVMRMLVELGRLSVRGMKLDSYAKLVGLENPQSHNSLADTYIAAWCYAVTMQYLEAMVEHGRLDHETLLNESYHRLGFRRSQTHQPLGSGRI